jgi:hypothetical protein
MKFYTDLNDGGNCRQAFQFYEQHPQQRYAIALDILTQKLHCRLCG